MWLLSQLRWPAQRTSESCEAGRPRSRCLRVGPGEPSALHRVFPHGLCPCMAFPLRAFRECCLRLITLSCPTSCDPMDCSPPGCSVRGILRNGLPVPSPGESLQPRGWHWTSPTDNLNQMLSDSLHLQKEGKTMTSLLAFSFL